VEVGAEMLVGVGVGVRVGRLVLVAVGVWVSGGRVYVLLALGVADALRVNVEAGVGVGLCDDDTSNDSSLDRPLSTPAEE
jgi:hypothetical protein